MSRPPRLAGFEYKGLCRYLITSCTHLRRPIFVDDEIASGTLAQFRLTAIEDRFAVVAYCVMPDHIHLLVEGLSVDSDLGVGLFGSPNNVQRVRTHEQLAGACGKRAITIESCGEMMIYGLLRGTYLRILSVLAS